MIVSVNDAAVMDAWKKDQGLAGSDLTIFVADVQAQLTDALGIQLTGAEKASLYPDNCTGGDGPNHNLGMHTKRCKRAAFLVEDGIIKVMQIAEMGPGGEFDPAGDTFPEPTCIENVLKLMTEGQPVGETGSTLK
jgi:peroxiredoxin